MEKKKFKHSARFNLGCLAANRLSKEELSIASKSDSLLKLFPGIDLEKNTDILGFAFPAAVVNHFNFNGQGVSTETASILLDQFSHKPTNIEHEPSKVVGHVVNSFFTKHKIN